MDIVLPLIKRDLARFSMLSRTIDKYYCDLNKWWVIVRSDEYKAIKSHLSDKHELIIETDLVPELNSVRISGWHTQQILKLAASKLVETDFYLLLDADVLAINPFDDGQLVINNLGVCARARTNRVGNWGHWAARVLHKPLPRHHYNVTPVVLNKQAVGLLKSYLDEIGKDWATYLISNLPWTEYVLYFTYLEATGRFSEFHIQHRSLSPFCVWERSQATQWSVLKAAKRGGIFTVFQSNTRINPATYAKQVDLLLRIHPIKWL